MRTSGLFAPPSDCRRRARGELVETFLLWVTSGSDTCRLPARRLPHVVLGARVNEVAPASVKAICILTDVSGSILSRGLRFPSSLNAATNRCFVTMSVLASSPLLLMWHRLNGCYGRNSLTHTLTLTLTHPHPLTHSTTLTHTLYHIHLHTLYHIHLHTHSYTNTHELTL